MGYVFFAILVFVIIAGWCLLIKGHIVKPLRGSYEEEPFKEFFEEDTATVNTESREILHETIKEKVEEENLNTSHPQPTVTLETQTPTINMDTNTLHTDYPNPYLNITNTADLVKAVMKNMGFLYEEFEEYPGILFIKFQGERLMIDCNRKPFLLILDQAWYSAPLNDLEQVSAIQKAVNNVNAHFLPGSIYYGVNQEDGTIDVYSHYYSLFVPQFPALDEFFRLMLEELLQMHRLFHEELDKCKKNTTRNS